MTKISKRHEEIVEICKTAITYTEVESKLGLSSPNNGIRNYIKRNKIDIPLYRGSKDFFKNNRFTKNPITDKDLCTNSSRSTGSIKYFLLKSNLKKRECEKCHWKSIRESDGKIPIELHHVNGDSSDNRIDNLQILCPNCHSLTDNYAGKNKNNPKRRNDTENLILRYKYPTNTCKQCSKLGYGKVFCSNECKKAFLGRNVPPKEILQEEMKVLNWTNLGKKYGVSDSAVRKWARKYKLL